MNRKNEGSISQDQVREVRAVSASRVLLGFTGVIGLYFTSLYSYLLFHSLAEIFSVIIAGSVFLVTWHSRRTIDNNYLAFIGTSYLFVSLIDVLHTFAYTGMGVFQGYGSNLPTQLWILARYLQGLSLLIAPFTIDRKLDQTKIIPVFFVILSLGLGSIFIWRVFPACYIEGAGLTPFKKISEYVISTILIASILLINRHRRMFERHVYRLLVASIIVTVASELAFTLHTSVFGLANMAGHLFKILEFYLIYVALVKTGIEDPHRLLYYNLGEAMRALEESRENLRTMLETGMDGISVAINSRLVYVNRHLTEMFGYDDPSEIIGRNTWELFSPDDQEAMREKALDRRRGVTTPRRYEVRGLRRDGSNFTAEVLTSGIEYDGQQASLGFTRDISERKLHSDRIEALHGHASRLALTESVEEVAEFTFDAIEKVLGFNLGGFLVVEGDFLRFIFPRGFELGVGSRLPLDGPGITVRAANTGETQLKHDVRGDEDFLSGPAEGIVEILSELSVPVKTENRVVAVIYVGSSELDAFMVEDQRLLEIVAMHVSSALTRLKQEDLLRRSEEKYRTFLESSMDPVFVNDSKKYLYGNSAAAEFLGFDDPSELVGRETADFYPPEDRELVLKRASERLRGLSLPSRYDVNMIKKDGTPASVEVNVKVIEYEGKQAILAAMRDITERKRLEEELRESEEQYRTLLDESMDALTVTDTGSVVYANRRFAELLGIADPADLIGRDFLGFVAEVDRERMNGYRRTREDVQYPHRYEYRLSRSDGTDIEVETWVSLIEYEGRSAKLSNTRDISDRKRMQELERLATIGEVAAMVAHDLRNPLTSIRNANYYIQNRFQSMTDSQDEAALKMHGIMEREILSANSIINDLLDFAARHPPKRVSTDLNRLIEESFKKIELPGNVEVVRRFGEGLTASVDGEQLSRVFFNIVDNALHAMRDGGRLTITTGKSRGTVEMEFTDTGEGIPEENIDKIFQPLFTTRAKGIGLGLAISRKIVEEHGGTIGVESEDGLGSSFTIRLPIEGRNDQ